MSSGSRGEQLLASGHTGLLFSGYVAVVRGSVDLACSDWLAAAGDAICSNYVSAKFKTDATHVLVLNLYIMHCTCTMSELWYNIMYMYVKCGRMHAFDWSI